MKYNNIGYIIVSRFMNPDLSIKDEGITLVYENRDMKIYKTNLILISSISAIILRFPFAS